MIQIDLINWHRRMLIQINICGMHMHIIIDIEEFLDFATIWNLAAKLVLNTIICLLGVLVVLVDAPVSFIYLCFNVALIILCRRDGAGTPITPPSTPGDAFLSDTPIQFDMISPSEESRSISPPRDGPPKLVLFYRSISISLSVLKMQCSYLMCVSGLGRWAWGLHLEYIADRLNEYSQFTETNLLMFQK